MTNDPKGIFDASPLSDADQRLVDLYVQTGRAVDELAYTADFETIYAKLTADGDTRTKAEVFRRLLNLRKAARLPRIG